MYGTELHAEQKPVEEKILQVLQVLKRKDKDEDSIRAGGVPGAGQCIHTQQDR
mgnify:CR=1 FL=1